MAAAKAPEIWQSMIEAWEVKLAGDTQDAEQMFEAARELAAKRGMRFLSYDKVARLPVPELMQRVDAYVEKVKPGKTGRIEAAAVLGMVEPPKITVTRALELFWQIAEKDRTRGKDEDQIRRWKNPRKKAIANFVKVIGDKPIEEISSDDLLDWRAWWEEKILFGHTLNRQRYGSGASLEHAHRLLQAIAL
ncbi:putative phage integrase family protein [Rhodobacter sphaeroides ATCC 17029]|nr:putative phage integrase family protein [Cereibacter sphaeroides ATCC 17029]